MNPGSESLQILEFPGTTRVVHHCQVAGCQQAAPCKIDRAGYTVGEQDLVGIGFDPEICQLAGHIVARGQIPSGHRIR